MAAAAFKDFFTRFATFPVPTAATTSIMLNMYVQQNKEVDMYPMEYILLGRDLLLNSLEVLLDDKLSTVVNGSSLRLFFWKLHNTVS